MRKTAWIVVLCAAAMLFAGGVLAEPPLGCCVCSDGRCIESVSGMQGCVEECAGKNTAGAAFNANGTCWGACAKARNRAKRATEEGSR